MRTVIAACGCGHDGRLGTGACDSQRRVTLLPFFSQRAADGDENPIGRVRAVRVGGYHNFAITTTGVFGWGLNENGQLGLGAGSAACVATPTRIPFFDAHAVVDIACGSYHTLAWTVDGLFACGRNEDGQLGLLREDDHHELTRVLSSAQVGGGEEEEEEEEGKENKREREEEEEEESDQWASVDALAHGAIRRGRLTHISCGTHHSLLAFRDCELDFDLDDHSDSDRDHHKHNHNCRVGGGKSRRLALLVAAAGKGDFGELGFDADAWSALRAKAKAADAALRHRIASAAAQNNCEHAPNENVSPPPPVQWRPLRARRASFSSYRFRPVALPPALMTRGDCAVLFLRASHLHSSVVFRGRAGERALHWGCYYNGGVEDDSASVPQCAGDAARDVHGGAEWLLRTLSFGGAEIKGVGAIGLGAEDSVAEEWTPLRIRGDVRAVSGREHCVLLAGDAVWGFGDNLHGQLGEAGEGDTVLVPEAVLRKGDRVGGAVVTDIRDAVGGARHSVFLIDIAEDTEDGS